MESHEKKGDRWLRLGDLAAHEVIVVRCPCGRIVEYRKGFLQRRHRLTSDTLVFDLQFRLRCSHCNCRSGFRITVLDERTRWDNSKPRLERVDCCGDEVYGQGRQGKGFVGGAGLEACDIAKPH